MPQIQDPPFRVVRQPSKHTAKPAAGRLLAAQQHQLTSNSFHRPARLQLLCSQVTASY